MPTKNGMAARSHSSFCHLRSIFHIPYIGTWSDRSLKFLPCQSYFYKSIALFNFILISLPMGSAIDIINLKMEKKSLTKIIHKHLSADSNKAYIHSDYILNNHVYHLNWQNVDFEKTLKSNIDVWRALIVPIVLKSIQQVEWRWRIWI